MVIRRFDLTPIIRLPQSQLPATFEYPTMYLDFAKDILPDLDPWRLISSFECTGEGNIPDGLADRYPNRKLVPFARKDGTCDIACFNGEVGKNSEVLIIHDYAAPGWELRAVIRDFTVWLELAKAEAFDVHDS